MILLQAGIPGAPAISTPIYFGIALAGVAVLLLIAALLNRRNEVRSPDEMARYSDARFRRLGRSFGLSAQHVEVLEQLVTACKVKRPLLIYTSAGLLDDTLKKGLYSMENSRDLTPEERENRKAIIFEIKQIMERSGKRGAALSSTTVLKPGQALSVRAGNVPFASKVVSNMKDFLTISAPPVTADADSRWMRGTRLSVYLWRDGDAGYSFQSKILGYDTVKGIQSVLIQHSKTLKLEQRRKDRRREILRPCFYFPIRIAQTGEGRRATMKAVVEQNKRTLGNVVDLSAGGCAIQTLNPLDRGKLVMVEFEIERGSSIRTYGKVVNLHRRKGRGGVMHIRFTRVTRQYLNRISEFVYGFSKPATIAQVREQIDRSRPGIGTSRTAAR